MSKAPGPKSLKVALVVWTLTPIIRAMIGRAVTALAATLLVVGSAVPLSFSSPAEKRQGQSRASQPRVSPDGQRIAYSSRPKGKRDQEIWVTNIDGTGKKLLAEGGTCYNPAWSPDGKRVAFTSNRTGKGEIYIVPATGGDPIQVTRDLGAGSPDWSPDGQRFVFNSSKDGNSEIYIINIDGTGLVRLTNNSISDGFAKWSPDGRQIAFCSTREGRSRIFVMNADGAGERQLG